MEDKYILFKKSDGHYSLLKKDTEFGAIELAGFAQYSEYIPDLGKADYNVKRIMRLLLADEEAQRKAAQRRKEDWEERTSRAHEAMPSYAGKAMSLCLCGLPLSHPIHIVEPESTEE